MSSSRIILSILAAAALAACTNDDLLRLEKPGEGPDEFGIVPAKPLEQPANYAELPAPTPGGVNLADQDPKSDAVIALGGKPGAGAGAIPAADGTLVVYAGRFGRDPDIRAVIEAEDQDFRDRRGRFTGIRLGRADRYGLVYEPQKLDPQAELRRWRRAGVPTPTAPPG